MSSFREAREVTTNDPDWHIVGQGMAGSMLGWACERAGLSFVITDRGHSAAASRVGAGLVSPLTGRRLVPTWQVADWRDEALATYRELEDVLGMPLVRELRVRRRYRDAAERARFEVRLAVPEVAAWVEAADADGLWLHGALQVETGRLIVGLRQRWRAQGRLCEGEETVATTGAGRPVIWCVGAEVVGRLDIGVAWEPSHGEIVQGRLDGLEPGVLVNDGHWLLPAAAADGGRVRVGASFRRDLPAGTGPTAAGQAQLLAAAERLSGQSLREPEGMAGMRVTVRDRRPVVGWLDAARRVGVFGGLAAKGALWAPVLARQWVADGLRGAKIDPAARAARFERTPD